MKYIIDTEKGTCIPYSLKTEKKITLADLFAEYRGAKEYSGIVEEIQKWYYGSLVKAPWCATSLSYFADKLGILNQIGGKNDNVHLMFLDCRRVNPKKCYIQERDRIKDNFEIRKGDILFWLWDGNLMTSTASKHVGVAEYASTGSDPIFCIGGNQKDKICTQQYDRKYLYMVFRPDYV